MNPQLRSHLEVSNVINWVGFYQWQQSYDRNLFMEFMDSIRGVDDD